MLTLVLLPNTKLYFLALNFTNNYIKESLYDPTSHNLYLLIYHFKNPPPNKFNVWKKRRERSKIVGTDFFQDLVIANNLAIGFCICQLMLACHFFCAKISAQYMLGGISKIKLHHSRFEEKKDSWIPVGTVM